MANILMTETTAMSPSQTNQKKIMSSYRPEHHSTDDRISDSSGEKAAGKRRRRFQVLYSCLGFNKGYNVWLFVILAGAMLGFSLARLPYLDVGGQYRKGASPGEWHWFGNGYRRVGITLHLAGVLPAGLLMVLQFLPVLRRRYLMFHRINGHVVISLLLLGNAGALMIARRAFGGNLSTQAGSGFLVLYSTTGMALAYYNVKMLQIDQHRAWMLRTMVSMGVIITTRLIVIIAAQITTSIGSYNVMMSCGELATINGRANLPQRYPDCIANSTVLDAQLQVVHANFRDQAEEIGASLRIGFGMALWLSIMLHLLGVEIYLALTPRESQRLRMVSYEKQLEAGMSDPGSAGLVLEKFADADRWQPSDEAK